ncbi:hypothetical protein PybrP1_000023 [[Pythium] brassicae (nom. inval.)]|nr:hypothetical protein PybrP1_000023 [[Pythium] brassicae (nom. inval.)]
MPGVAEMKKHMRLIPDVMADANLKKIYSMSFSPFEEKGLIAAGGHQGFVSVYPGVMPLPTDSGPRGDSKSRNREAVTPLMSFKAHSGWVSSVSLAKSVHGKRNLLLTASNDALVKVWDLNQSSTLLKSARELLRIDNVHRSGIFGMDVNGDDLLTCSKDATIALSRFRDGNCSTLEIVHRFLGHEGVVKSIGFSRASPSLFASGGNDRVLRAFDVRQPERAVLEIRNAHSRAINSVQWHPSNANCVLSASFDPELHLFDTRKPSLPLFTFSGHYHDTHQNTIYHPLFVDGGDTIATAGGSRCQEISLYRTSDGSTVSRGFIGMRIDYVVADPFQERVLIASGGQLEFANFRRESLT